MQDPVLSDFPDAIDSPNLHMRVARSGDGRVLHAALIELLTSGKSATPVSGNSDLPTVEGIERACREAAAQWILRERFLLLNFDRVSGELTGSVGLQNMQWDGGRFELSLWERPSWQGKGRLIEAMAALFDHAFSIMGARRISCVIPTNSPQLSLMLEVAGMRQESRIVEFSSAGDVLQYAITTRQSGSVARD